MGLGECNITVIRVGSRLGSHVGLIVKLLVGHFAWYTILYEMYGKRTMRDQSSSGFSRYRFYRHCSSLLHGHLETSYLSRSTNPLLWYM
jgi:hypothetical protein